jgi:hypothetical protein
VTAWMAARDVAKLTGVAAAAAAYSCYDTASVAERALTGGGEGMARSIGAMMVSVTVLRASGRVAINGRFAAGLEVGGGLGFTRGNKEGLGLVEPWNWNKKCGGSRLGREWHCSTQSRGGEQAEWEKGGS